VALLLALLVLVILILLVNQMTVTSLHDRTVSENHLADLQNTYGNRSGYHQALLFLKDDAERAATVDSLRERWASPIGLQLGKANVQVTILDCERFISLARLVNEKGEVNPAVAAQLRRLVRILRHPPDTADRIIDYIDADTKGSFESRARNDRLMNAEELLRIEGIEPVVLYGGTVGGEPRKGLLEFVTVWPRAALTPPAPAGEPPPPPETPPPPAPEARININTAPAEVLEALSDEMTPQAAQAIVAWRLQLGSEGKPQQFSSLDDLSNVPGLPSNVAAAIKEACTVKATTFEIRSKSQVGNVEKTWIYVVAREAGEKKTLKLLSSQRLNEFVTAQPPPLDE
jgi:type II secretory pathway component PulK